MKIGLLTLPLHVNYGGILQCYALQTMLRRMGHDVTLLSSAWQVKKSSARWRLKNALKYMAHLAWGYKGYIYQPSKAEELMLRRHVMRFVADHIRPKTEPLYTTEDYHRQMQSHRFEAIVVGSDQVWRPCYTSSITDYYLKFAEGMNDVRRIAYAASFGTNKWEYTPEETNECRRLIREFHAVSVREKGAVGLCRERYDIDAIHVLDPTLLLERTDYESLATSEQEKQREGTLFNYILDPTEEKQSLIASLADSLSLTPFGCMPTKSYQIREHMRQHAEECCYPPVTQWIRSFMDAEMVITDSFHGCVFAILFNKPFWVIVNEDRGRERFDSLLKMFDLQDRIITQGQQPEWDRKIDWKQVNAIHQEMKRRSLDFLECSLKR